MDIKEPQVIEIFDTDITPTDPAPIESAPVHHFDAEVEPMPAIQHVDPELRSSSRVRTQAESYTQACQVLNTPMP